MTETEKPDEHRGWMQDGTESDPPGDSFVSGEAVTPAHGDALRSRIDSDDTTAVAADEPFPWPPGERESILSAFVRTWQGATFQPARFFGTMPEVSMGAALLYYLPLGILAAGADLFWNLVLKPEPDHDTILGQLTNATSSGDPLVSFLLAPFLLLISLFLSAAFTHAILKLLSGTTRRFRCTFAVFAFCYSPVLFGVVPMVGVVVGFAWAVVITIVGLREAQRTTTGRAAVAVLTPLVVLFFMIMMSLLVLAAAGTLLELPT